jgi:FAD synthase
VEEGITEPLLEAHILDPIDSGFGSAGQYFTMTLEAFLRPEKKFKSVEDLKTQIRHDLAEAEKHRS